jgi:hypothetical protein
MQTNISTSSRSEEASDHVGAVIQDWARIVSFQPQLYFRPQNLEELKGFLASSLQGVFQQRKPRVLGGLHSCSEICVSDSIIDVSDLPRTIEFNEDNSIATVSANWHLHDFLKAISERGKSITATGGTDHQTLAGIISTNTAGATPHHTIYETVEWIEYLAIDSDGKTVVEKRVSKNEPAFAAVVCSLGAIGIITKLQVRLVDELFFHTTQKIIKLKTVLTDVWQTSQQYDFWRIDWIPDTDVGLLWAAKQIPAMDIDGDYPIDQSETILEAVFKILNDIASAGALLDNAMRLVYAGLTRAYGEVKADGPLRNMLPVDRRAPLRVAMAEWSFDPSDLNRLLEQCKVYFQKNGWPNLPIEIELTKTDNYWMSPWNWTGLDYVVKFNFMYLTDVLTTPVEKEKVFSHLQGLWDYLIQAGIPFKAHWGKINFMDPAFVHDHFMLDAFQPYIQPLFINKYLEERLLKK